MSVRRDLYETCSQPLHKAGISPPILQMSCRGVGAACSLQARAEGVCKCQVFPSLGGAGVETGQKQGLSVAQAFLIQSKQIKPGKRAGKLALPHTDGHASCGGRGSNCLRTTWAPFSRKLPPSVWHRVLWERQRDVRCFLAGSREEAGTPAFGRPGLQPLWARPSGPDRRLPSCRVEEGCARHADGVLLSSSRSWQGRRAELAAGPVFGICHLN